MNEVPHYNAFISYRHHPQDIAVAEAIHKGLEHFRVPSSLRKKGKKIERIFRDKEELPITSSLTDTITQALANSDYQIVICSTHLKDSYWVQREIETFLKTHTKDQVLTVIVDGEPYDVIPEILTYREVEDPVTGEIIREPLEPLSCDWRLPKRKAVKTELPRLAAVLLGCTYNDLIQRQKQYRMRQLAIGAGAGMAASLALAAYFLYTSIQIQENLNQSLMNQSQYLASAANDLYDNGDRLTAIALALEALPSEENERPYVADAEKALSNALMLYNSTEDIIAVGSYAAESLAGAFVLSDDGKTMYLLDSRAEVTSWNTETFEKIGAFHLERSYSSIYIDGHSNLLAEDGDLGSTLKCFTPQGELLWQREDVREIAFLEGKETLLVTTHEYEDAHYLLHLDTKTGEEVKPPVKICPSSACSYVDLNSDHYYPDYPYALTLMDTTDVLALFDPDTGKLTELTTAEHLIHKLTTLPDGRVLALIADESGLMNGIVMNMTTVSAATADLFCFNAKGKQLWKTTMTNHLFSDIYTILPVGESGNVFAQYGNNLSVLSGKTGETLSQVFASTYPLYLEVRGEESVWGVFGDGGAGVFKFETQQLSTIQYMEPGIINALKNQGVYTTKQLSTSVTKYMSTADYDYESFGEPYGDYVSDSLFNDRYIVIDSWDELAVFDMETRKRLWIDSQYQGDSYFDLLGFSADGTKVYAISRYDGIKTYDLLTGEKTLMEFPEPEEGSIKQGSSPLLVGDTLYYLQTVIYYMGDKPNEVNLVRWNLTDNTYTGGPIVPSTLSADWNVYGDDIRFLYADDIRLLMRMPQGQMYEYLFEENTASEIFPEVPQSPVFLMEQEPFRMTMAMGTEVLVLDENYETLHSYALPEASAVSLFRHEDGFYALADDGFVYCFREDDPHPTKISLSLYTNFYSDVKNLDSLEIDISWAVTPDDRIVMQAANMGNVLPIGEDTYCTDIPHLVCYHAATDSFICTYNNSLVAYKRLSLDELLDRGRETLGTFTLTEEQRTAYGLVQTAGA